MMDEMAIRQHVEFYNGKFYGYSSNCGQEFADDSPVTMEALVFMVVALNQSWKMTVGYFLVEGIAGVERANLMKQCIRLLYESGIEVKSLTFDGAAANLAMARNLGCSFDTNNLKTDFVHPVSNNAIVIF